MAENPSERKMFFVYVIKSLSHKNRYVGSTDNIDKRIREHNLGKCRYTKGRIPWSLIFSETYSTRNEAMKRERFLKSGKGREWLNKKFEKSG